MCGLAIASRGSGAFLTTKHKHDIAQGLRAACSIECSPDALAGAPGALVVAQRQDVLLHAQRQV